MNTDKIKELMKPIADGLFGPQRQKRGELPHYTLRSIGLITRDLVALTDEEWGMYAFSREILKHRFTPEEQKELAKKANECGREYADKIRVQYNTGVPFELAAACSLKVDYPEMPQSKSRVLFAEYREPDKVHIYMDGVKKGEALFGEPGVMKAFNRKAPDIADILLSHEIFHYVEERNKSSIWTKTYRKQLMKIGPLKNMAHVNILGEIAAMAFAKELTGISFSPYVLDAFLVYGYSPEAASGLYEEMMELAGKTPNFD